MKTMLIIILLILLLTVSGIAIALFLHMKKDRNAEYEYDDDYYDEENDDYITTNPGNDDGEDLISNETGPQFILTVENHKLHRTVKQIKLNGTSKIGRELSNDIRVVGRKQHRFELQVGLDEKGYYVNSLDNTNGTYFYGTASPNQLLPKHTLSLDETKPLTIIYADLTYRFVPLACASENKGGIHRYEEMEK